MTFFIARRYPMFFQHLSILVLAGLIFLHPTDARSSINSGAYKVTNEIAIVARYGIHDKTSSTKSGFLLLSKIPQLSERAIQERAAEYLKHHMRRGVVDHIKFQLPARYPDLKLSPNTMVIKIDYMARVLDISGHHYPIGSMTVRVMFPLFSEQEKRIFNGHFYNEGQWEPVVPFFISENPSELNKNLDDAMDSLLGADSTYLYLSGFPLSRE